MQIRTRLTLQFTLLVSAIVLLGFLIIYYFTQQFIEREFYRRLRDKAITQAILLIKIQQIDSALLRVIDRAKRDVLHQEAIVVYDSANVVRYNSEDSLLFQFSSAFLDEVRQTREKRFKQKGFDVNALLFPDRKHNYVVVASAIDLEGRARLANLRSLLALLFLAMIALVATTGWVYSGRALRPIQKVIQGIESLSPQQLDHRLAPAAHRDEIGKLIDIFNEQLDRIAFAFQQQKTFVANVSHELNNPLTKITSQLEVTLIRPRTAEEYEATLRSVLDDIRELNQLSSSLLELARISQKENSFVMTPVRLDEVLWDIRDSMTQLDPSCRVDISIPNMPEDESQLCVKGSAYLIQIALKNIIDNACKFSPDQRAFVELAREGDFLRVSVSDQGIGIRPEDLPHLFQPFYRADATAKTRGYGVGLSLSQRIISVHHGEIDIQSAPGKGTTVRVRLPGA